MTKILLIAGYCCLTMAAAAQRITIPLQAENWTFRPGAVQFTAGAMKITSSEGVVRLKSFDFTDGTIEFDHQPVDQRFASIYFRWQDSLESECFYFRTTQSGDQPAARSCQLRLGFSNDVWVYINGRFVYSGKNYFGEPSAKLPDGRLSIENTTVTLPLQQGDNELMIGVGNDFFGWAIMARLDDVHGIGVER